MYQITDKLGVNEPDSSTRIIRVFSRDKYIDLLNNSRLWLSSIDHLQRNSDSLERVIPDGFFKVMSPDTEDFYRRVNNAKDAIFKTFISCWSQHESHELWKNYDPSNNGIAIVSTVGKLISALGIGQYFACIVKYIDHSDRSKHFSLPWVITDGDTIPSTIRLKEAYKDSNFVDDDEIRIIGICKSSSNGIYAPVSLIDVIDEIIISPYANGDSRKEASNFLSKYPVYFPKIKQTSSLWLS